MPNASSRISDAPSVIVLVGRTGLDAALRLDDSIELVRVKTASEAIAAVATESASRGSDGTPMAVIVSEEVRDGLSVHDQAGVSGMQRFTRVLSNLRPGIEVMFLGQDGVTAEMIEKATRGYREPAAAQEVGASEALRVEPARNEPSRIEPARNEPARTIIDDGMSSAWASVPDDVAPETIVPERSETAFAPTTMEAFAPVNQFTPAAQLDSQFAPIEPAALTPPPLSQVVQPAAMQPIALQAPRVDAPPASRIAAFGAGSTLLGVGAAAGTVGAGMMLGGGEVRDVSAAPTTFGGGLSSGAGLPVVQAPVPAATVPVAAPRFAPGSPSAPLAPPAVVNTAAFGAIAELGSSALFGARKDDAAMEIGAQSPGDALLVRSLLKGQDVQGVAMEMLRARSGDSTLGVVPQPEAGKLSVPLGDGLGWLCSSKAERIDQLRPHAAWLAGWLRLRDQQAVLADAALRDSLTGAWNRRYLDAFLGRVLQQARDARQFVSVMIFDIDNFKHYNDRYGHDAGDQILKEVVDVMRGMVRPSDRVCRIGGDEFAVVFHDPQGPRQIGSRHPTTVEEIARRFQQRIAEHHFPKLQAGARLTISGGLATFPWDGLTQGDLLSHADSLSMASKRAGKNAIVLEERQ